jgi:hypothetical protein
VQTGLPGSRGRLLHPASLTGTDGKLDSPPAEASSAGSGGHTRVSEAFQQTVVATGTSAVTTTGWDPTSQWGVAPGLLPVATGAPRLRSASYAFHCTSTM